MKANTWHGKNDVRVEEKADPTIVDPRDAIVKVTLTAICGSDLQPLRWFHSVDGIRRYSRSRVSWARSLRSAATSRIAPSATA